jgi:hypothetical protein
MLEAIDQRALAVRQLGAFLEASGEGKVGDKELERLEEQWRGSWDESLRAAREATTASQELRARLGLQPAPEEAIR